MYNILCICTWMSQTEAMFSIKAFVRSSFTASHFALLLQTCTLIYSNQIQLLAGLKSGNNVRIQNDSKKKQFIILRKKSLSSLFLKLKAVYICDPIGEDSNILIINFLSILVRSGFNCVCFSND